MIGYKVVRHHCNDKLYSCVTSLGAIEYIVDEFVRRIKGNGPLTVFKTLQAAKDFITREFWMGYKVKIYKCEYSRSKSCYLWERGNTGMIHKKRLLPHDTDFANRIKLIKEAS